VRERAGRFHQILGHPNELRIEQLAKYVYRITR
jgi:hypothetical protein